MIVIRDPLTKRSFALPEEAEVILSRLESPRALEDLSSELEASLDPEEIEHVVEQLRARHLLDEGLDEGTLRARIAEAHRAECWEAMRMTLRYAAEKIPIYQKRYAEVAIDQIAKPDDLLRLPLLTKADIRAHYPAGFVPEGRTIEGLIEQNAVSMSASSGTSAGDRLQMISSVDARSKQMIAGGLLNRELADVATQQQSVLTSMHCADPNVCVREEPRMERRIRDGIRHLLIPPDDPSAPTKQELKQIVEELGAHKPLWLDCNPTYLVNVAYALRDAGLPPPKLRVITCGFEFLSKIHRRFLKAFFGCSVYNRYTASELGNFQILECEAGRLHVNDRYYFAELVRGGRHVEVGEMGRLIQTTVKETIPLVRYDTGDLFIAGDDFPCPCGGVSRTLGAIAGRASDLITAPDGSPRTTLRVDDAMSSVEGLRFYQVEQIAPVQYEAKIVVESSQEGARVRERAREALASMLGAGAEVRADIVKRTYPEPSGKFRLCRSRLPALDALITA
jgi:phenylacetate-CoA ligase